MEQRDWREIPWNYTSADDEQIFSALLGREVWSDIEDLRARRKTGRSARHVLRVVGDLFVLRRNAFVFHEFVMSQRNRAHFLKRTLRDIALAKARTGGDASAERVLEACSRLLDDVQEDAQFHRHFWKHGMRRFSKIVGEENCSCDPYDLVAHATDATDWRHHLPILVVKPGSAEEVARVVRLVRKMNLRIIPRGGGTGLTGGAVPLDSRVVILNTERLNALMGMRETNIEQADGAVRLAPVLSLQAGVTTEEAMKAARDAGLVFATDPTSSWACTIGGNIAENAGGKSAVAWGTALDNVLSFRMVMPDGGLWEVSRKFHPLRKISPDDKVVFEVRSACGTSVRTIEMMGEDIRRRGLWKDVSNKWLGGVPGLQKEGVDGVIVDAKFLLHREFKEKATLCIEFFGNDMDEAACCIRDMREQFSFSEKVSLVAMEHFDAEYCSAIQYKTKSSVEGLPKAVLLIDLGANEATALAEGRAAVLEIASRYRRQELHWAKTKAEATQFWADRKKLGAIAKRTNAFKLNEDIVLPIERVPEFVRFCDDWNVTERARTGVSSERHLIIATHMHAGDGNIHVNIPVFSNDREMLKRAHALADNVMALAKELGGAVSGEHGIGITKVKYLEDVQLEKLRKYRAEADPQGMFNPRKLVSKDIMSEVFTPSFNLLKIEARILQHGRLSELSTLVAGCVRCGKCKPVCSVHSPGSSLFYSPRDKILAIGALVEALLYDTQRRSVFRVKLLRGLKNISEHCTLCHKCADVCPVGIDKGKVSLLEREILAAMGLKRPPLLVRGALGFLESQSRPFNAFFRSGVMVPGMKTQRVTQGVLNPLARSSWLRESHVGNLLASAPQPPPWRGFQSFLPASKKDSTLVLRPVVEQVKGTVFYFPGCGSERMFSDIALAASYLLVKQGFRVVLAPAFMCCGFPHRANALPEASDRILLRNSIVFSRLREMIAHWQLDALVVTCGTCKSALAAGEVEGILNAKLQDTAQFLADRGFRLPEGCDGNLYHAPCHDSLGGTGTQVLAQVTGAKIPLSGRCCSEAGTLAMSRPDIAKRLRATKASEIVAVMGENGGNVSSVLTNCPSCLQGLSRQQNSTVKAEHIVVAWAPALGGKGWKRDFKQVLKNAERVNF